MEFPRDELEALAMNLYQTGQWRGAYSLIHLGIKRFDQLALRCVEDNTKHSLTIAALRARIAELEAESPPYPDPHQLSIDP